MGDVDEATGQAVRLAHVALRAEVRGDRGQTEAALDELAVLSSQDHSGDVIQAALCAWADAYVQLVTGEPREGDVPQLVFWNDSSEDIQGADDVPPPTAWAGRWVVARGQMDLPMVGALLAALCEMDEGEFNEAIVAVLQGVAMTIRHVRGPAL